MLKAIFPLTLLLVSSLCSAEGISGFWQHPKDPVWIEVTSAAGNGLAVRNDNDPSSIGFAVLKEVTVGNKKVAGLAKCSSHNWGATSAWSCPYPLQTHSR